MITLVGQLCLLTAAAGSLSAASLSFTGMLNTPEDVFEAAFTLGATDTVIFQSWGFGGGTNAAGQVIPAGGFDPLIALYDGQGTAATISVDGSANPLADADNLVNGPWSYVANCPPGGTVVIGANNDCGDVLMQVALAAGDYTLLLTDANYLPTSIFDNGALSEGFTDFTGGVFQTCDSGANACISPNGTYAVDIVSTEEDLSMAPEPGELSLSLIGLLVLALLEFRKRRTSSIPRG